MAENRFKPRFRLHLRKTTYKQNQIAHILGVDASTLSKWVNNPNTWPADALTRTCEILELNEEEKKELFELAGFMEFSQLFKTEGDIADTPKRTGVARWVWIGIFLFLCVMIQVAA
jgi:hypothetical protein